MNWSFFGDWVLCWLVWTIGWLFVKWFLVVLAHVAKHPE